LPFFKSETRGKALGGMVLLICLLLAINGMNVVNSFTNRNFMTALSEGQGARFFLFAGLFVCVFGMSTIVEVFARYTEQRLGLFWREWLTRRVLDRYLSGRAYLHLIEQHEIDNPDERMSEDVKIFTSTTLSILVLTFDGIMILVSFSSVLWLITPWLFFAAIGYALAGTVATIFLGRRLIALNDQQLRREADFRYYLGRVREHAEEIAAKAGEEEQKRRLHPKLSFLLENYREIIRVTRNLGFFTIGYQYLPQIIPVAVVAPLYFSGQVEFGAVTQGAMAFSQVQGAFSLIITQFQTVTTYVAVIGRLGALWEATRPALAEARPSESEAVVSQDRRRHEAGHVIGTVGR